MKNSTYFFKLFHLKKGDEATKTQKVTENERK